MSQPFTITVRPESKSERIRDSSRTPHRGTSRENIHTPGTATAKAISLRRCITQFIPGSADIQSNQMNAAASAMNDEMRLASLSSSLQRCGPAKNLPAAQ